MKRIISLIFTLAFLTIFSSAQTVVENRSAFSTADAPWLFLFDLNNLQIKKQQYKPDNKSAYFMLTDEETGFNVSLFIEPVEKCKTSAECRDFVWKTGNPAWGKMQDVVQSKIGEVSYFEFYRPTVRDVRLEVFDMYAEFVENGYWVDLHMSKVQYKKQDHSMFENFVKSVKFIPKKGASAESGDKIIQAAQKSADEWLDLWDAEKYRECFDKLSLIPKKILEDKDWLGVWTQQRKPLGKLKSRKLFEIQTIKEMKGMPGTSGVVFRYQSSFENNDGLIEMLGVVLDTDGRWRVIGLHTSQ